MKLAVLQRIIQAGQNSEIDSRPSAVADVWKIARTVGGDHIEYNPSEFSNRIRHYLKLQLRQYDKKITPWYSTVIKRIDQIYTTDEVIAAFEAAWNDVTREIKRETIKIL